MTTRGIAACLVLTLALTSVGSLLREVSHTTGETGFSRYTLYTTIAHTKGLAIVLAPAEHARAVAATLHAQDYTVVTVAPRDWNSLNPPAGMDLAQARANWLGAVQRRYGIARDGKPLLVGVGDGAAAALAWAAEGPYFHALLTLDYCPGPTSAAQDSGPAPAGGSPWYVFIQRSDPCASSAGAWLAAIPGAHLTMVQQAPLAAPEFPALLQWLDPSRGPQAGASTGPNGLPLVEITARDAGPIRDTFAVFLSGDGGWAELDRHLSAQLAEQGIPVVGWDSLSYYWRARTPEEAAADLNALVREYALRWKRPRVLLVGYSFGADVLPFLLTRLPAESRAQIGLVVMLGLSTHANFEFHLSQWLTDSENTAYPTAAELRRLSDVKLLCIGGADDADRCPPLAPPGASVIFHGDHHFDGDYAGLSQVILAHLDAG